MARTCVYLNIYDMYWLNEYASNVGVGVYHSGVEIYGSEYAYGGHPLPFSGIFENSPRDAEELGDNFKFRESILLGETDFAASEVKKMIQLMGEDYRGDRYHLITKNCNHFTSALAKTLTGSDIPSWVNRLASISGSIPFLERWIPAEWLTPIALQQSLDEKSRTASRGNSNANVPTRSHYGNPSTSTGGANGAAVGGVSAASWKWFQRRASSTTNGVETATARSAPNTARSADSSSSTGQSLTKLWNSIKNIASSATDSCAPSSSSSAAVAPKKSLDNDSRPPSSPPAAPSNNSSSSSSSSNKTNGLQSQQRNLSDGQ